MKTIKINGWEVRASIDDDCHLMVTIHNDDGSMVLETRSDIDGGDLNAWGDRFTTRSIESEYIKSNK